jgi:hypothetical protein
MILINQLARMFPSVVTQRKGLKLQGRKQSNLNNSINSNNPNMMIMGTKRDKSKSKGSGGKDNELNEGIKSILGYFNNYKDYDA